MKPQRRSGLIAPHANGGILAGLHIPLVLICSLVLLRAWVLPISDSLWLDETGTVSMIGSRSDDLWKRSFAHPNSPPYVALLRAWTKLAGRSEIALRLPSVLAMAGAFLVAAAILRRFLGPGAGWSVLVFALVTPEIQFHGLDARPYAFSMLLFAISWASLLRLHSLFRLRSAIMWAISTGLMAAMQPADAITLLGQPVWLAWTEGRALWQWKRLARWAVAALLAFVVALPEIQRIRPLVQEMSEGGLFASPGPRFFGGILAPPSILGPAALASAIVWLRFGRPSLGPPAYPIVRLCACTAVMSVLAGSVIALTTFPNIAVVRYFVPVWWAWLLLIGLIPGAWERPQARVWFVTLYAAAILAASFVRQGPAIAHSDVDWRGAMAAVKDWQQGLPKPLLLQTGFIEGSDLRHLENPYLQPFLSAPAVAYPHFGSTKVLPFAADPMQQPYWEKVAQAVAGQPFALMVYESRTESSPYTDFFARRFGRPRSLGSFRRVRLYVFESR